MPPKPSSRPAPLVEPHAPYVPNPHDEDDLEDRLDELEDEFEEMVEEYEEEFEEAVESFEEEFEVLEERIEERYEDTDSESKIERRLERFEEESERILEAEEEGIERLEDGIERRLSAISSLDGNNLREVREKLRKDLDAWRKNYESILKSLDQKLAALEADFR
jgi:ElaB/YqjD/DUF883 family membrane-anchored ribosome-binding protein